MEAVGSTPVILADVRPEDVTAHRLIEKGVDRAVSRQTETVAQGSLLESQHRLGAPLLAVEDEARKHLLGRVALVTAAAAELFGKIDGQRLERAHAVVVQHVEAAELVGGAFGQDGHSPYSMAEACGKEQREHPFPYQRTAQQAAVSAFRVCKHPRKRDEQQRVAGVSKRNAVGVVIHGERAAAHIAVV